MNKKRKTPMKRMLAMFLVFTLAVVPLLQVENYKVAASETFTIEGVVSSGATALDGMTVNLLDDSANVISTASTNSEGKYTLTCDLDEDTDYDDYVVEVEQNADYKAASLQLSTININSSDVENTNHIEDVDVSVTAKADSTISFAVAGPVTISNPLETTYNNVASVDGTTATIVYSSSDLSVATVNAATGEVTKVGLGTVTITASATYDDDYKAASASYSLIFSKGSQSAIKVHFGGADKTGQTIELYYGATDKSLVGAGGNGTGAFVFSSSDDSVVAVDPSTGKLTAKKKTASGTFVTITAKKLGDSDYDDSAEATVKVKVVDYSGINKDSDLTIAGAKNPEAYDSDWFNGSYTITAAANVEISLSENTGWGTSLTLDTNGKTVIYARKKSGADIIGVQKVEVSVKYDATKPTAKLSLNNSYVKKIISGITFGVYKCNPEVTITTSDSASGVYKTYYYMTTEDIADPSTITAWNEYHGKFAVTTNFIGNIYVKVVDKAGNVQYDFDDDDLSGGLKKSKNLMIDNTEPVASITVPGSASTIYSGNVNVTIVANDASSNGIDSGVKEIAYHVYKDGAVLTQSGVLYTATSATDATGAVNKTVTVKATENSSNNVKVVFKVTDYSNNEKEFTKTLKIDVTKPVVSINYNNGENEASGIYNADKIATIEVNELNFDSNKVTIVAKNLETGKNAVVANAWDNKGSIHTKKVYFKEDGVYEFSVSCVDKIGNKSASMKKHSFIIDKTNPKLSVTYDNNAANEGKYYSKARVATVEIVEHNFDKNQVVFTLNGNATALGAWNSNGDVHTARIQFDENTEYTWSMAYTDKAGNTSNKIENENFVVDMAEPTIAPVVVVGNNTVKEPKAAYNDEKIGVTIDFADAEGNLAECSPKLTVLKKTKDGKFETETIKLTSSGDGANNLRYSIDNLKEDGIYNLSVSASDKAGNNAQEKNMTFSVNRNGATFGVDATGYTYGVIQNYYVQSIDESIVINESDVNKLNTYSVSLNGVELVKDTDYTVEEQSGDSDWYNISYKINKENFADEGEYSIVIKSENSAGDVEYSDVKNLAIAFVVDRTAPSIVSSGIESDGKYQASEQEMTIIPTDDGGMLETLSVTVFDSDNNEIKDASFSLQESELQEYLTNNGGQVSVMIPEGNGMTVKVSSSDKANNVEEIVFNNITVSSNAAVIFFARIGYVVPIVIAVVLVAIIAGVIIVVRKKRKVA